MEIVTQKTKTTFMASEHWKWTLADYKTFKTKEDCVCNAKDKNGIYFWDSKIDLKDNQDSELVESKEKL